MRDSRKDFLVRQAQTFDAANWMWHVCKSDISMNLKIRLFRITVESVLLYDSETWWMTKWLKKELHGAYTQLLWKALNISWRLKVPDHELYGGSQGHPHWSENGGYNLLATASEQEALNTNCNQLVTWCSGRAMRGSELDKATA